MNVVFSHMLVDLQDGGQVVAPVAVVGSTEDSGHLIVVFVRVPFVHELVGSGYHAQFVGVAELLCDILNIEGFTSPNRKPAPLGLYLYPWMSSGSLQTKSQPAPFSGIYWTRGMALISSSVLAEGESPPCMQNIWPSTTAVRGI